MIGRQRNILLFVLGYLLVHGGLWWHVDVLNAAAHIVHYHAGFVVYNNGAVVDFSDNRYMYIEPCTVDEQEPTSKEEAQLIKAHLHGNVGDIVHVHRASATWRDLFRNLDYDIRGPATGFVNGERMFGILNRRIHRNDRVLILIGDIRTVGSKFDEVPTVEEIRAITSHLEQC